MRMIWALPLLMCGGTAQAGGLTAADLAGAAGQLAGLSGDAAAETERLRLAVAYDPAAALGSRPEAERALLSTALGTGPGRGDLRARWFMAGAVAQTSTAARTTLYNPMSRGWLILDWHKGADGQLALSSATARSAGPVTWTQSAGPYLRALATDYSAARTSPGNAPIALSVDASDRWLEALAEWAHPPRMTVLDDTRRRIAGGKAAALGAPQTDLLPVRIRNSFSPVAAFTREDRGRSVLFGSPLAPAFLIAADFDAADVPTLKRLTFANLDNAGDRR